MLPSTFETVPMDAFPPASAAPGNPPAPPGNPVGAPERDPLALADERVLVPPSAGGVKARVVLEEPESCPFSTRMPA